MQNDLESPVFKLCPKLLKLKEKLKSLKTEAVMVSGSGPSVYAITASLKEAQAVKKELSRRYAQVFVAQTF